MSVCAQNSNQTQIIQLGKYSEHLDCGSDIVKQLKTYENNPLYQNRKNLLFTTIILNSSVQTFKCAINEINKYYKTVHRFVIVNRDDCNQWHCLRKKYKYLLSLSFLECSHKRVLEKIYLIPEVLQQLQKLRFGNCDLKDYEVIKLFKHIIHKNLGLDLLQISEKYNTRNFMLHDCEYINGNIAQNKIFITNEWITVNKYLADVNNNQCNYILLKLLIEKLKNFKKIDSEFIKSFLTNKDVNKKEIENFQSLEKLIELIYSKPNVVQTNEKIDITENECALKGKKTDFHFSTKLKANTEEEMGRLTQELLEVCDEDDISIVYVKSSLSETEHLPTKDQVHETIKKIDCEISRKQDELKDICCETQNMLHKTTSVSKCEEASEKEEFTVKNILPKALLCNHLAKVNTATKLNRKKKQKFQCLRNLTRNNIAYSIFPKQFDYHCKDCVKLTTSQLVTNELELYKKEKLQVNPHKKSNTDNNLNNLQQFSSSTILPSHDNQDINQKLKINGEQNSKYSFDTVKNTGICNQPQVLTANVAIQPQLNSTIAAYNLSRLIICNLAPSLEKEILRILNTHFAQTLEMLTLHINSFYDLFGKVKMNNLKSLAVHLTCDAEVYLESLVFNEKWLNVQYVEFRSENCVDDVYSTPKLYFTKPCIQSELIQIVNEFKVNFKTLIVALEKVDDKKLTDCTVYCTQTLLRLSELVFDCKQLLDVDIYNANYFSVDNSVDFLENFSHLYACKIYKNAFSSDVQQFLFNRMKHSMHLRGIMLNFDFRFVKFFQYSDCLNKKLGFIYLINFLHTLIMQRINNMKLSCLQIGKRYSKELMELNVNLVILCKPDDVDYLNNEFKQQFCKLSNAYRKCHFAHCTIRVLIDKTESPLSWSVIKFENITQSYDDVFRII